MNKLFAGWVVILILECLSMLMGIRASWFLVMAPTLSLILLSADLSGYLDKYLPEKVEEDLEP